MPNQIGVLTTYYSKNYGAVLQAYATLQKLRLMGYDCELINYKKENQTHYTPYAVIEDERNLSILKKINRKIKNCIIKIKKADRNLVSGADIRDKEFDLFVQDYLVLGKVLYTSQDDFINAVDQMPYDVYLCGSDQIWNPIVHNFDDVYYLNFPTTAKKVSYASSVAYNRFSESEIERICGALSSIDSISVREKSTVEWMQPHMEKKVNHVIDPTFLLNKNEWMSLTSEKHFDGKYILVYLLNYNEQNKNAVNLVGELARKKGCRVICLPYTSIKFPKGIEVEYRYDIAPNDFIQLLNGAECVITNSFHATALSVNLNIPFFVVSSYERNKDLQTRISDLLEETGLNNRKIYPDTESICMEEGIDYESVNVIISKRRNEGIEYLKHALECGDTA